MRWLFLLPTPRVLKGWSSFPFPSLPSPSPPVDHNTGVSSVAVASYMWRQGINLGYAHSSAHALPSEWPVYSLFHSYFFFRELIFCISWYSKNFFLILTQHSKTFCKPFATHFPHFTTVLLYNPQVYLTSVSVPSLLHSRKKGQYSDFVTDSYTC